MINRRDDRSPVAAAFAWVSRITTIAIGMVVPGIIGFWVDHKFGTLVFFTILGCGIGVSMGVWQLVRLANPRSNTNSAAPRK